MELKEAKRIEKKVVLALEEGKISEDKATKLLLEVDEPISSYMSKAEKERARIKQTAARKEISKL